MALVGVRSAGAAIAAAFVLLAFALSASAAAPTDGLFSPSQWSLSNTGKVFARAHATRSTRGADIDARRAWRVTTGSRSVVVGVVDTGVFARHEDLRRQIWTNPGEVVNGKDDDRNGKVDDVHGWDFVGGDANTDDVDGHGTHVAGIIDGSANGHGTVGVAWHVRVMPVRTMGQHGGSEEATAAGLGYAADEGARIVNMSFTVNHPSPVIDAAILAHPRTLFVGSAGNSGLSNDRNPVFPCDSAAPNVICVANSDQHDRLWKGILPSAWGTRTVDLAAPGTGIVNADGDPADRGNGRRYNFRTGTSMAAAHVSGIAALIASESPRADAIRIKSCILAGVDKVPALRGYVATGGRANAARALAACRR